jgi:S1-C subfamily serine protease
MLAALLVLGGAVAGRALVARRCSSRSGTSTPRSATRSRKEPLPSAYAKAYAAVRPSVVRVVGLDDENEEPPKPGDDPKAHTRSTGTGVVIVDNGTILTNLHVVVGAKRISVTFFDGTSPRPRWSARSPRTTSRCCAPRASPTTCSRHDARHRRPAAGDQVLAVGFPFGIGPSASAAWSRA